MRACMRKQGYGDKGWGGRSVLYQEHGGWTGKHRATCWLQLKGSCAAPVSDVPQMAGGSRGSRQAEVPFPSPTRAAWSSPQQARGSDLALGARRVK